MPKVTHVTTNVGPPREKLPESRADPLVGLLALIETDSISEERGQGAPRKQKSAVAAANYTRSVSASFAGMTELTERRFVPGAIFIYAALGGSANSAPRGSGVLAVGSQRTALHCS
jgi:hypothetical protein